MLTSWDFKSGFRSLMMHRLRTFLSTLGILFGVAAVVSMLSIGEGAKQETLEQIEQLGTNTILIKSQTTAEDSSSNGLTWDDAQAFCQNIPFLFRCAPLKIVDAVLGGTDGRAAPEVLGVNRLYGELKGLQLAEGRFLCDLDVQARQMVCVLGYDIAKSLGREGHVGHSIRLHQSQLEIVGILNPTHWKPGKNGAVSARNLDQAVFIPLGLESLVETNGNRTKEELSEIILQMQESTQLAMAVPLVRKLLVKLHKGAEDYQIVVPQELLLQAQRTQRTFNAVLGSIAAISLLVGGVGIMNIMLATVSERTREIGIRRAVGANSRHILKQFIIETLMLTVAGALFGVVLGIGTSYVIGHLAEWKTSVTLWSIVLALFMSCAVGLCSGIYPAYHASKMDPIAALRRD